jgi:glc operon protein GlcG
LPIRRRMPSCPTGGRPFGYHVAMLKLLVLCLSAVLVASAAELPTRKYLNLAAIKTMVAAAENEAAKRNVQVTICIMDESGNLLFLQRADGATLGVI